MNKATLSGLKPWLKCGALQDLMAEHMDPNSGDFDMPERDFTNFVIDNISEEGLFDVVDYAIKAFKTNVLSAISPVKTEIERRRRREQAKRMTDAHAVKYGKTLEKRLQTIAVTIMNMTGEAVRTLKNIPMDIFNSVKDEQRIGEVMSVTYVLELVKRYHITLE